MADPANVVLLHPQRELPLVDVVTQTEQSLLGGLLMNARRAITMIPAGFASEHYLDPLHRDIHDAIVALGDRADALTVSQALAADDDARRYISGLLVAGSWMNVDGHANAVTEAHQRREVIQIAQRMIDDARDAPVIDMPATAILNVAMARIDALTAGTQGHRAGLSLTAAMDAALAATERAHRGQLMAGRSTGMTSVDDALGGLEDGTFVILGGRPGQGKTALAVQWALHVARTCRDAGEKAGVGMFSLEMGSTALARRVLAEASRISVVDLKRGRMEGRFGTLTRVRGELGGLPFWIEDAGGQNLPCIRQRARAMQRMFGRLALLVVDHIQIVKPDDADRRNGGTQAVGRISNQLRDLSKEFECPVLCLSQLSRQLMGREDKRPNMGDLRQAGDIEQDADVVMFVHREEAYLHKSAPPQGATETAAKWRERVRGYDDAVIRAKGKAELILEKVRDGEPRTLMLKFDGPTTSFSEAPDETVPRGQSKLSDWHDKHFDGEPPKWAPL